VLRDAVVAGRRRDVRLAGGRIADIAPAIPPSPSDIVVDAAGRWLYVGLHDHHLHLRALSAKLRSVEVGPDQVRGEAAFISTLRAAGAALLAQDWLRAVGYHESVAGLLNRYQLDRAVPDRPVRVQHRSGELWIVNSIALDRLGFHKVPDKRDVPPGFELDRAGTPTGRLWRLDRWLEHRWPALPGENLAAISRRAAAMGVTGWTDATPDRSDEEVDALTGAVATGEIVQRLHLMVRPGVPGVPYQGDRRCTTGAVKILLDDTRLPTLESLVATVQQAHGSSRAVAVHCVTRVQTVLAVAALEAAVAFEGDRIEHGALIPTELVAPLRRIGATVVTQPNFVAERGDTYLDEVDERDRPDLWRARSLVASSVRVAAGTDAPFGSDDPWVAVRAAVDRSTVSGRHVGSDEAVSPETALSWFSGRAEAPWLARLIEPGAEADLVLLDAPPEKAVHTGSDCVAATIVAGSVEHGQDLLR